VGGALAGDQESPCHAELDSHQRERPDRVIDVRDGATTFDFDVAIVGLGYVGLPTALALHDGDEIVLGLDVDPARLAAIRAGRVDLIDSDRARLAQALGDERFVLSDEITLLSRARAVIVCVPTPIDEHLLPDLGILRSACASVVDSAVRGQLLVLTSTTYVGSTTDLLVEPLRRRGLHAGEDVHVCFSPERIDPGNERHPQQTVTRVVGGVTPACTEAAMAMFATGWSKLHPVSSPDVAEMSKLLENTFRAVNIAFANEMADICRAVGIDVIEVIDAAATKPYGFMPFFPGPGVGGHCIPCDPQYLLWQMRRHRLPTPVIENAMGSISSRPATVVGRARDVLSAHGKGLSGARVLVVGVTYKPGVEDVRESPALEIIERLRDGGAEVGYLDPLIPALRLSSGAALEGVTSPEAFDADLVLVHTAHPSLDLSWLEEHPAVLDTTFRLTDVTHRAVL
jgi:nucleotide sugar dehydrogenase